MVSYCLIRLKFSSTSNIFEHIDLGNNFHNLKKCKSQEMNHFKGYVLYQNF